MKVMNHIRKVNDRFIGPINHDKWSTIEEN